MNIEFKHNRRFYPQHVLALICILAVACACAPLREELDANDDEVVFIIENDPYYQGVDGRGLGSSEAKGKSSGGSLSSVLSGSGMGGLTRAPSNSVTGARPPSQPTSGPAGTDYKHQSFKKTVVDFGQKNDEYTKVEIYEPAQPTPVSAPILFLIHGWSSLRQIDTQQKFVPFLQHATKRGFVTVLVRYGSRAGLLTAKKNQAEGVKAALAYLETKGVRPNGKVGFVGSSLGGSYVFQLAHDAKNLGIPQPQVIATFDAAGQMAVNLFNLQGIPPTTRVVLVAGETENVGVGDQAYPEIWRGIEHIPADKKLLVMPRNDNHGSPAIVSDHGSCNAPISTVTGKPDLGAEDWYGCYKPILGAMEYEFMNGDFKYIDPRGSEVRNMGTWSDGTPVKPALLNEEALKTSSSSLSGKVSKFQSPK